MSFFILFIICIIQLVTYKMMFYFVGDNGNEFEGYFVDAHDIVISKKEINSMPESKNKLKSMSKWVYKIDVYINRYG